MSNPNGTGGNANRFKSGAEWKGNAKGRPRAGSPEALAFLKANEMRVLEELLSLCLEAEDKVQVQAIAIYLRKTLPDLKSVERKDQAAPGATGKQPSIEELRLWVEAKKLAAAADEPESH